MKSIHEPSQSAFLIAISVSIMLAIFGWKYVEAPFRNKNKFNRKIIFICSFSSIMFFLFLGAIGHLNQGFSQRFAISNIEVANTDQVSRRACSTRISNYVEPNAACEYSDDNNTSWAVFGDSHAEMLTYALVEKRKESNEGLMQLSHIGCPPALLYDVEMKGCTRWTNDAVKVLEGDQRIKNVVLAYRHNHYLAVDQLEEDHLTSKLDLKTLMKLTDTHKGISNVDAIELYWQSVDEIVSRLLDAGKTVYILQPVPELPIDIRKGITPFSIFDNSPILDLEEATTKDYYQVRNADVVDRLNQFEYGSNLKAIKPQDLMCNDKYCSAIKNGMSLYLDDDHLNYFGSKLLIDTLDEK